MLTPGEPERAARVHRQAHGIAVDSVTWAEILRAAEKAGLAASEVEALAVRV